MCVCVGVFPSLCASVCALVCFVQCVRPSVSESFLYCLRRCVLVYFFIVGIRVFSVCFLHCVDSWVSLCFLHCMGSCVSVRFLYCVGPCVCRCVFSPPQNKFIFLKWAKLLTQPRMPRTNMQLKVNFLTSYSWFEFRVFVLLDWLPYQD